MQIIVSGRGDGFVSESCDLLDAEFSCLRGRPMAAAMRRRHTGRLLNERMRQATYGECGDQPNKRSQSRPNATCHAGWAGTLYARDIAGTLKAMDIHHPRPCRATRPGTAGDRRRQRKMRGKTPRISVLFSERHQSVRNADGDYAPRRMR